MATPKTSPVPSLRYVSDAQPGYSRHRWGKGFTYRDWDGNCVRDKALRRRFKALVIPPFWEEVWICREDNGHLLCTGRDAAGRKQYIYHPTWIAYRQLQKFERLQVFAEHLPELRRVTAEHLQLPRWDKEKVLALIVHILDEVALRIGNKQYAKRNNTYGLTTLRRKHLDVVGEELVFEYKAKSNKQREVHIDDEELIRLIRECSELPGYEVFRYRDETGKTQPVDSHDVNEYLRAITGEHFYCKDFRTWAGSHLAVEFYPAARRLVDAGETNKQLLNLTVERVAAELGNTPSVCREYYIHPSILHAVEQRTVPALTTVTDAERRRYDGQLDDVELLTVRLMDAATAFARLEAKAEEKAGR